MKGEDNWGKKLAPMGLPLPAAVDETPFGARIASLDRRTPRVRSGPNGGLAASMFLVDLSALRALKSVALQIECLIVGRDACVAKAHVANPKK
jgi:hypothetical protein